MSERIPSPVPPGRPRPGWLLAVVPLIPAIWVGFLLDDWIGLARLSEAGWATVAFQAWPSSGEFLRPLGWALFQLELSAFGARGFAFHAVHLALFVAGAWLTGRLAGRLAGDDRVIPIATALALLYPGRVESYAWLAAGFDLLALDLGLAILLLHLRWRSRPTLSRCLSVGTLAFLSTLAKESAYAVVGVVLLWEIAPRFLDPVPARGRWTASAAVAGGFGLGALYRLWALGGVGGYPATSLESLMARLPSLPETVTRSAFVPVNPHFAVSSVTIGIACAIGLCACLAAAGFRAVYSRPAWRLLAGGLSIGLVGLLPVLPYQTASMPWTTSRFLTFFGAGLAMAAAAAADGAPTPAQRGRGDWLAPLARAAVWTLGSAWTAATLLNLLPWLEAAHARDAILDAVGEDTRSAGPHQVWIAGPINRLKGVHLLGGGLEAAIQVTYPERTIEADSAFFQQFQGRPVGPGRAAPGVQLHLYSFDPAQGVERLPLGQDDRDPARP